MYQKHGNGTRIAAALALFWVAPPASPFWEKVDVDGDIGLARDSNLANGRRAGDRIAETSVNAGLTASRTHVFARSAFTYGVRTETTHFETHPDLRNWVLAGFVQFMFQPLPGYAEPWFEAGLQEAAIRNRNSEARDGSHRTWNLGIAKRFTDRVKAALAFEAELRTSRVPVLATTQQRWKAVLDYKFTERSVVSVGAARGKGDYVFTQVDRCAPAQVCMIDAALRHATGGTIFAFRAGATRHDLSVNYRYRVTETLSLDAVLGHTVLQLDSGDQARRTSILIGVANRF